MIEKFTRYADKVGVVMSVMSPEYEGGDFCQGLTAAFETKAIILDLVTGLATGMMSPLH